MLKTNLPVLILNNIVFPSEEVKLEFDDSNIKKTISLAENYFNGHLLIVVSDINNIVLDKLPKLGVVANVKLKLDMPNGKMKVTFKGVSRVDILNYHFENGMYDANIKAIKINDITSIEALAKGRILKEKFIDYLDNKKSLGNSIVSKVDDINDLSLLTDVIASFMPLSLERKTLFLREINPLIRYEMLIDDLNYELSLLEYENSLDNIIEKNLEEDEKKFILKQKLKVIQDELGIEENNDVISLKKRIDDLECPIPIRNKLNEELEHYKLCNSNSPEIGILRNYIETLLSLPWSSSTRENNDIESIRKILNESHFGLDEVKERIMEFMATKKYTRSKHNPIICLVGPPGIGKTSLAQAISVALKRKCVKISVGGINDEAEITGHRRAYVGALPGKIISGMIKVGVNNPVFIIDEIDKMTKDIKGDPASSLLEVLDKEQNERFVDHFVEEEFDLSKVLFILTANYIDNIPSELKDRLEIIELSSYTILEKVQIVKNYLLKKMRLEYHLTKDEVNLTDDNIIYIINNYTKESGIRELERLLRKMCRKYICYKIEYNKSLKMNDEIIRFLGKPKYTHEDNYTNDIGTINVLSYHPLGGELLKVESALYPGNGNITSTGSLGDVIKESIEVSLAYLKSHTKDFDLDFKDFQKNDFFIHFTMDAIKKDGPSAGVSITSSIISLLKKKVVSNNISMSGEISLSGKILKVGGLKEKIVLALKNNIDIIYLPKGNQNEVMEYENIYKNKLKIIFVDNYLEIYKDLFQK